MVKKYNFNNKNMQNNPLFPRYLFRKKLSLIMLKNYFPNINNFLEIGAGRGDYSKTLSEYVGIGDIIEFSQRAIPILEERLGGGNINIIHGDFLDYNFLKKYSLIVMFEVLEHIKDDELAIRKINNLLSDNGLLLLSVPSKSKKMGITDQVAGHYRRYDRKNLIKLLEKNNFEIIELASYGFPLLNITTLLRNIIFKINSKKIIGEQNKPEDMSKSSGMGYLGYFQFKKLIGIIVKLLFANKLMDFYVKALKPFNQYDLGDGYLCLANKKVNS